MVLRAPALPTETHRIIEGEIEDVVLPPQRELLSGVKEYVRTLSLKDHFVTFVYDCSY